MVFAVIETDTSASPATLDATVFGETGEALCTRTITEHDILDAIFVDGFESGDLTRWSGFLF